MRAIRWLLWHSYFTKFNFIDGSVLDLTGLPYEAPTHPQSAGIHIPQRFTLMPLALNAAFTTLGAGKMIYAHWMVSPPLESCRDELIYLHLYLMYLMCLHFSLQMWGLGRT